MNDMNLQNLFSKRILPAITFDRAEDAEPTARALFKAGLNVMEIPFRTEVAAECIRKLVENVPEMHVGAGTILTVEQVHQAKEAGAKFGLAPGFNPKVVTESFKIGFPFIPGIMTPSELELAFEMGCKILKIFPVSLAGGADFIKAISGPYQHLGLQFIPMGGINLENMNNYLRFPEVMAVGGSWLVQDKFIREGDFLTISKNVEETLAHAIVQK